MSRAAILLTTLILLSSSIVSTSVLAEGNESRDPPTVKIGFLYDMTGPIAVYGPGFSAAANIAEDHINSMQSQYNFEIVYADSGCDGSVASYAAQSLINDGVVAVSGAACSGASIGANSVLSSYGIPQISYASTSPALSNSSSYPGFMRVVPSDGQSGQASSYALNQTGSSNPALLYADDLYWLGDGFIDAYGQSNLCGTWDYDANYHTDSGDFSDEVYSLMGDGCDSVVMFTHSVDGAALVEELRDLSFSGSIVGGGDSESNDGIIGSDWPDEFDYPSEANGVHAVKRVYPGPQTNLRTAFDYECSQDSDCDSGIYTNEAYDSIRIIADAYINRTSYSSLEVAIMGTGTNWEGASGYATFLPNGDIVGNGFDICEWVSQNLSCTEVWLPLPVTEVEIIFVDSDWDPIIPNMNGGGMCDAILSAMTKTDDREDVVDFTRSYYTHSQGIIGASGSASITDVSDLNTAGTIIGVQSGTYSEFYAQDNLGAATIYAYDAFSELITALNNGDTDYALGDTPVLSLEGTIMAIFEEENFGIAVREDSGELLDAINVAITRIVDSGEYDLIFGDWFNGTPFLIDDRDANTATSYPIPSVGSTLSSVLISGELRVCAEMYYPPFTSYDNDGNPVGFDVDIGEAVVNRISNHYFPMDSDGDGWTDSDEIDCSTDPNNSNSVPYDSDSDGFCNHMDIDDDNDGWSDADESINCGENNDPLNPLDLPTDTDSDQICDGIDDDDDNDGYLDAIDWAPTNPNEWMDTDGDGTGDNTDFDDDGDSYDDTLENECGSDSLDSQNIPLDTDNDSICDVIDEDDDNDGILDANDAFPLDPNENTDTDEDGIGNNADNDDDGDSYEDAVENECGSDSLGPHDTPLDTDMDSICDITDEDDDNDGILDANDAFPLDPNENTDTDEDGIGNNADNDDDGDLVTDVNDFCPQGEINWTSGAAVGTDLDGDGCRDEGEDLDDDGDGVNDTEDSCPLGQTVWTSNPVNDADNDGCHNMEDDDDDGDGVNDNDDEFPYDSNESNDSDGDGIGDNSDEDVDGDGVQNSIDVFPLNNLESVDTDEDGIGDNADTDDDNDGVLDEDDLFPLDPERYKEESKDSGLPGFGIFLPLISMFIASIAISRKRNSDGQ